MPEEGGLDVLGVHVLAPRRHQHLIRATRDEEAAACVQIAEIARPEPAVAGEGVPRLVGQIEIPGEHAGAPNLDLALAGFLARWGGDAEHDSRDRPPRAVQATVVGQVEREHRRGLGQPVSAGHVPAQAFELPGDGRLQRRASRGQQPEPGADPRANGAEQARAPAQAEPPTPPDGQVEREPDGRRRTPPTIGQLGLDGRKQGTVQTRHPHQDRSLAFLQRPDDLGAGERIRQDEGQPERQGSEQTYDERIDVMQGEGEAHAVARRDEPDAGERVDLKGQVAVTQRDALWRSRRARGVEQGGGVGVPTLGKELPRATQPVPAGAPLRRVQQDDAGRRSQAGHAGRPVGGREDEPRRAVGQGVSEGLVVELRVQGNHHGACPDDCERRGDPLRPVRREQGGAGSGL